VQRLYILLHEEHKRLSRDTKNDKSREFKKIRQEGHKMAGTAL
jgi:hypothetical protein